MIGIRRAHSFTRRDEIGGEDPVFRFRAIIDLTPAEIAAIPLTPGTSYVELMHAIAPYIVGWNLRADGELVAPPSIAGVVAFEPLMLDRFRWLYLAFLAGIAAGYLVQPRDFGASIVELQAMLTRSVFLPDGKETFHVNA